jgi:hypothetical protein
MSSSQAAEEIGLESTLLQEVQLRMTNESKLYVANNAFL